VLKDDEGGRGGVQGEIPSISAYSIQCLTYATYCTMGLTLSDLI
jgi:hypothetical protein